MSLVYVHGIGNRAGTAYDTEVGLRDAQFERFLIPAVYPNPAEVRIFNPPWGKYGARLHWDGASLLDADRESLGRNDLVTEVAAALGDAPAKQVVTEVARTDLRDAIDLLYSLVDLRHRAVAEVVDLADLASALVGYCDMRAQAGAAPEWLASIGDDLELVDRLARVTTPPVPLGSEVLGSGSGRPARDILLDAVEELRRGLLVNPAGNAGVIFRRFAAKPVSLLLGDIITYFDKRGTWAEPGDLIEIVVEDIERASHIRPLVIVAHSIGAAIAYDIVSYFRPDIEVDVLVTVGSQVGLFEELKMFRTSDGSIPGSGGRRVPMPPNVRRWINILDRTDLLAFRAEGIFQGVKDLDYSTRVVRAHGAYFRQPNFHARLAAKVQEVAL